MSKSDNMNIDTGEKTWLTPPNIIRALGTFDLDPCCPPTMPWRTATQMVCRPDDGLAVDWTGKRVWLNPPYGRESVPFLRKMAANGNGIALLFGRTDTKAWHELVFHFADSVFFMKGRIKFLKEDGTSGGGATAPSNLVAYSKSDTEAIMNSGLEGWLLR